MLLQFCDIQDIGIRIIKHDGQTPVADSPWAFPFPSVHQYLAATIQSDNNVIICRNNHPTQVLSIARVRNVVSPSCSPIHAVHFLSTTAHFNEYRTALPSACEMSSGDVTGFQCGCPHSNASQPSQKATAGSLVMTYTYRACC